MPTRSCPMLLLVRTYLLYQRGDINSCIKQYVFIFCIIKCIYRIIHIKIYSTFRHVVTFWRRNCKQIKAIEIKISAKSLDILCLENYNIYILKTTIYIAQSA
ncbi:unnamed protein product [Chrysodeixis includens]|uniref:Uncharacterized protein n=1 Tax=Chrysodeixis includens TaxID=689277 RepID=A0A9N8PYL0_CHRIL|nr:unnamed protein product [Chrysodeixis includens]